MDQILIPQVQGSPRKLPKRLVGGKGYSKSRVCDWLRKYGLKPLIPRKEIEKRRSDDRSVFDRRAYRRRSIVAQTIGWLKECRRIGASFTKLSINFLAMIKIARIQRCLKMAFSDTALPAPHAGEPARGGEGVVHGVFHAGGSSPSGRETLPPRPLRFFRRPEAMSRSLIRS
jgi:transposase